MIRKIILAIPAFIFAFAVLFISIFRTASVSYNFESLGIDSSQEQVLGDSTIQIDYYLPFPGRVLPDSILWPLKAIRDRVWLWVTTSQSRKAELNLLFADKRLGAAQILIDKGDINQGVTTLTKAEKYLEEAGKKEEMVRKSGSDTSEFMFKLCNASLKHYQIIGEMIGKVPEEARPLLISTQDYSKRLFENERNGLLEIGKQPPQNPFGW